MSSSKCRANEACYNAGCRSELCKRAAAEGRRERRQREREAVGEFVPENVQPLTLVQGEAPDPLTCDVARAVAHEIGELGSGVRLGLAAAAMALAEVLDNPRATSSKPAAAGALVNILNQLRKGNSAAKPTLAAVRAMTSRSPGV